MTARPLEPRVLVIGLNARRVSGPWDSEPVVRAVEAGMAEFVERGVGAQECLFGLDGHDDPEAMVTAALRERAWECVVIGGGVRNERRLDLFERVVNLVHRYAPGAAIAFSDSPSALYEAAARWLGRLDASHAGVPARGTAPVPSCGCDPDLGVTTYARTCDYCGTAYGSRHCVHDQVQEPCPECDTVPPAQLA